MSLPQNLRQPDHTALIIAQHLIVPEAQDTIAFRFQNLRPGCVAFRGVLAAIDFDDDPVMMACEIGNVVADGNLATETGVGEELAQKSPHALFCGRWRTAQFTGADDGYGGRMFLHSL